MIFSELIEQASNGNDSIRNYIGRNFVTKANFKLRPILETLLSNDHNKRIEGQKQITLTMTT